MTINSEKWIKSLPNEWSITKIGNHFKSRNEKVNDTDYPPLSVAKQGVVPQIETVAKTDANDNRKLVLMNDFVINSRSDRKESCGLSKLNGSVSLINHVLYQNGQDYYMPFVGILFKNYGFAEEFYRWGHGIVADLWTTRWQEMKNIEIPLPPLKEQKLIFDFLTNRTSKIDQLISNQEKQIEKLKEYRQAIITKAVTKGLYPNVPMKDSGVEWIGEVPLNWMTPKFKNLATLSNGREIEEDGGDIPVYGSGGIFKFTKRPLFEGISLLTGRKGTIDNPMLVNGAFWTVDTMFYTSSINLKRVLPEYLFYAFKGCCNFGFYKSGSVLPSMTQSQINNIIIPLPTLEDQKQIVAFLQVKMGKIDSLLSLLNRNIEKLNSYKKSLIYEYVTGKKRVSL